MSVSAIEVPTPEAIAGSSSRERLWRAVRWATFVAYVVFFVFWVDEHGFPFDRLQFIVWVVGALAISCLGRSPLQAVWLLIEWTPIPAVFLAYDLSRGAAENIGMPVQVTPQIWAEKVVFFGEIPTVHLQEWLYTPGVVSWWQAVLSLTYASHFVLPFVVAGALWARNRHQFRRFIVRFVATSFLAVAFFVVCPTAPPWMAAEQGHIDQVERIANKGWSLIGLPGTERWVLTKADTVNQVAAIPSLHAGFAILIAMFFWSKVPRRFRPLLLIHPLLMTFTIVYGGEHYAVDALAGWGTVALACWLCTRVELWWSQRRRAMVPATAQN